MTRDRAGAEAGARRWTGQGPEGRHSRRRIVHRRPEGAEGLTVRRAVRLGRLGGRRDRGGPLGRRRGRPHDRGHHGRCDDRGGDGRHRHRHGLLDEDDRGCGRGRLLGGRRDGGGTPLEQLTHVARGARRRRDLVGDPAATRGGSHRVQAGEVEEVTGLRRSCLHRALGGVGGGPRSLLFGHDLGGTRSGENGAARGAVAALGRVRRGHDGLHVVRRHPVEGGRMGGRRRSAGSGGDIGAEVVDEVVGVDIRVLDLRVLAGIGHGKPPVIGQCGSKVRAPVGTRTAHNLIL